MRDADVGMWRFDPDTETFQYSEAVMRRSGLTSTLSYLPDTLKTLHPDDLAARPRSVCGSPRRAGSATCHLRRRRVDGGWRHTLVQFCSAVARRRESTRCSASARTSPNWLRRATSRR